MEPTKSTATTAQLDLATIVKRRDELQGLTNRAHDQEHEFAGGVAALNEIIALMETSAAKVPLKAAPEPKGE